MSQSDPTGQPDLGLCDGVKVYCPPGMIEPRSPSTIYVGEAQQEVVLRCSAAANPNVTYKWYEQSMRLLQSNYYLSINPVTGDLTFPSFSKRQDGVYTCAAVNEITDATGKVIVPIRLLPPITVFKTRINAFHNHYHVTTPVVNEGEYAMLVCGYIGEDDAIQNTTFTWTFKRAATTINLDNDRLYIDLIGNLHFTYTLRSDAGPEYMCLVGSTDDTKISQFGGVRMIVVKPLTRIIEVVPVIKHTNTKVKVLIHTDAVLECVFHAYDRTAPYFMKIRWYQEDGEEIETIREKYILEDFSRRLRILNVTLEDERNYYCQAKNGVGHSTQEAVFLDVISPPIFVEGGAPADQTVKANSDAIFDCNAASLHGDQPVEFPVWYINDRKESPETAHERFQYSNRHRRLTFKSVVPVTDIVCIHCIVRNEHGATQGTGCLQVVPTDYWPRIIITKNGARQPDTDHIFIRETDVIDLSCGYPVGDAEVRPKMHCDFDATIVSETDARVTVGECPLNGRSCTCTGLYGLNYRASVHVRLMATPDPEHEPKISVVKNAVRMEENPIVYALDGDSLEITCALRTTPSYHYELSLSCDFLGDDENSDPAGVLKLVAKKTPMHMKRCYCGVMYGCNATVTRDILLNVTYVNKPKLTLEPNRELARQSCVDGFLEDVDQLTYIGTVDLTEILIANRKLAVVIETQAPGEDFLPMCRVDIYVESCGKELSHKECYCSWNADYVFTILIKVAARSSLATNKMRMHWPGAASGSIADVSNTVVLPKIYAQYNVTLQQNTSYPVDLTNYCILTVDKGEVYELTFCVSNMDSPQIFFHSNGGNSSTSGECLSATLKAKAELFQTNVTFLLADDRTCDRVRSFDCLVMDNSYRSILDQSKSKISSYVLYAAIGAWVTLFVTFFSILCICWACRRSKKPNKIQRIRQNVQRTWSFES